MKKECHCKGNIHIWFKFSLILLITVLSVYFVVGVINQIKENKYIGADVEVNNTITVTGKGEIYVRPDIAQIVFSVTNEAKTVSAAMSENTAAMNKVIAAMKDEDIKEKDLKTTNFNIYPRYEYEEGMWGGKRTLSGYEVSQSLQVKIRDMDNIGDVIQSGADAGANQVGSLNLMIDDEDEYKKEARELAIDEAKQKARELASALGVDLLGIKGFSENSYQPYYFDYARSEGIGAAIPDVEIGENKIEINVSIVYEIN